MYLSATINIYLKDDKPFIAYLAIASVMWWISVEEMYQA